MSYDVDNDKLSINLMVEAFPVVSEGDLTFAYKTLLILKFTTALFLDKFGVP